MALSNLVRLRLNVRDPYREFQESQLGNGSALHFRLSSYPVNAASEQVYVGGVLQSDPADYSLDDDTGKLTFVSAPGNGTEIFVRGEASVFSDTELNDVILQQGNVLSATLHVLRLLMADHALREKWRAGELEADPSVISRNLKDLYDLWLKDAQAAAIDSGGVEEWAVEQQFYR